MAYEYYLLPPVKQKFYRILALAMTLVGCGNQKWWGFEQNNNVIIKVNRMTIKILAPIVIASQLLYLYVHFSELTFSTLGIMFSIFPISCIVNIKLFSAQTKSYKDIMTKFINEYHLYHFKDHDEYIKLILIKVERLIRWTSHPSWIFIMIDAMLWVIIPMVNNVTYKELVLNRTMPLQTAIYLWMPFDYSYNYQHWIIIHTLSLYLLNIAGLILFILDSLNYTIVFHLVGHIKILKHKINSVKWDGLTQMEVKDALVDILRYHSFVKCFFNDTETAFGPNVGAIYLLNLFVDSMLLYQLMFDEKTNVILYGLMFFFYMAGLILMSMILEEIRKQSDDLSDVTYNMPWETMSIPNQKIVLLMLAQAQPPLVFKATGGVITGVRPMISIIKTTFSYYVMLKSTI